MKPPPPKRGALPSAEFASQTLARAATLPACVYTDAGFVEFERRAVFARSWQLAGRSAELAQPGDLSVAEIAARPVILVRGEDRVLRGFFNVCKHRGGPLAIENGNVRQLQCKYHGWTYTLEGRLRAAHEMQEAEDFDLARVCLDAVQVDEWEGFAFASLEAPSVTLEQLTAGVAERIAPVALAALRFHARVVYEVRCNWKVYVDNYLEGYHLPHVHPGLNRLLDYREYTTQLSAWYSHQHSPMAGGAGPYAGGEAHYYFLYPNLMLNILPGRLQTNLVVPLAADRCRVFFDYYYADSESEAGRRMIAEDLRFSDQVQKEDMFICEQVQKGLESGAYTAGRLSPKREAGVHHFQELLRAAYRRALEERG